MHCSSLQLHLKKYSAKHSDGKYLGLALLQHHGKINILALLQHHSKIMSQSRTLSWHLSSTMSNSRNVQHVGTVAAPLALLVFQPRTWLWHSCSTTSKSRGTTSWHFCSTILVPHIIIWKILGISHMC